MAKQLIQLGVCVLLAGCAPAGTRQQALFSNTSTPAAGQTQQLAQHQQPEASQQSGFSVGKMLQFVGFQKKEQAQGAATQGTTNGVLPPELTQLGSMINEVAGRAAELNVNDQPEVTRQKAIGILDVLQQWDGQVAKTQAAGGLNPRASQLLNSLVGQIRDGAQKLVQYVPTPENIAAVKQTASNLYATGKTLGGVLQQVNGISSAFTNQTAPAPLLR